MPNLSNIGVIREVLARHGFTFSKALGQNFLINPSVCPRMAEAAHAAPGYGILEIGAGIGVLTAELAARAERVVCVEIDGRLLPVLEETLSDFDNVEIVNEDVLKIDLHALIRERFAGLQVAVAANLPYYITSPIVMKLLEERLPIESITVMVQKEAATRLCAAPGERACGAVSLAVQYYSSPEILFPVSRGSFLPAPNVDSCVIRLTLRREAPIALENEAFFFSVVRAAFSQRRKTILNTLSSGLKIPKGELGPLLEECRVSPSARAEALTLEQFGALANALYAYRH
ncbi:MAG: 16S rRNA (adenine(1518)-N(6)/adenine(1519)-N(6))-dimethyltransferase RsmA [Clostridiales bacterium]|uniref:16S rRNA (adenine(1518)-N(6)/adenine(1519)-N(6))- dimethyltransferase RsmA n=1 Tax=Provencibacterium massiliense TaxID=1841868 RepID=UPI0009A8BEF4|nr:16S rRNA (adenine(1518)-N(6)/adenine(1519)-N(6))-dimethyltransferase RsmA [Provencibacterium massiliense]PWM37895.1 MAG: 16S rRNA (adenine(1518)-N(6)/adenine(1519)-N(6))-dimethyltransferase RsmA [Clostridiales bacterium]